jgi:hypothetical protein
LPVSADRLYCLFHAMRRLIRTSILYIVWATAGAVVAIIQNRPAEFGGQESGLPVVNDFVYGMGTALSPTLWWILLQGVFTDWARRAGRLGRIGIYGLIVFGVCEFIGALGEPITYEIFRPETFDPFLAAIQGGMIVLPALVVIFGFLARGPRNVS